MNNEKLIKISGAIITSFINLHYLEECKHLGVFKQSTKNNVKRTLIDLKEIENEFFNEIEKVDENDLADKLTANHLTFVEKLIKFNFNDYTKLQEVLVAYSINSKRITSISDKILKQQNKYGKI